MAIRTDRMDYSPCADVLRRVHGKLAERKRMAREFCRLLYYALLCIGGRRLLGNYCVCAAPDAAQCDWSTACESCFACLCCSGRRKASRSARPAQPHEGDQATLLGERAAW